METPRFNIFQMILAAIAGAALVVGLYFLPSAVAPEEQLELHPFARAARLAERVDRFPLRSDGDALKLDLEKYMWKDVYMMGEVFQVIEITSDGAAAYRLLISTIRQDHPDHDANVWRGGFISLLYFDAPYQFSVSEGDIVEFVATVKGFDTYTSKSGDIVTLPLLLVTDFQELAFPGTVESAR